MKRLICLLLTTAALAQGFPKAGQTYQSFQADLDRDGKTEKVGLVAYDVSEEEYWGQLVVWDRRGRVLWRAPRTRQSQDPLAFGGWPYGVSEIQVVRDVDGDGRVELLAPLPQSDVSPTTYRLLRWDGKRFAHQRTASLLETPPGSGRFLYRKQAWDGNSPVAWIARLGNDQTAEVTVASGSGVKLGKARVKGSEAGFEVTSWIQKPVAP